MTEHKDADKIAANRASIKVNLPPGLPQPTPEGWRILLEILVELSTERGFRFGTEDGKQSSVTEQR